MLEPVANSAMFQTIALYLSSYLKVPFALTPSNLNASYRMSVILMSVALTLPKLVTVIVKVTFSSMKTSPGVAVFTIVKLTGSTVMFVVFLTSVLFSTQVTFTLLVITPVPLVRTTT